MLYNRDYITLTADEKRVWEKVEEEYKRTQNGSKLPNKEGLKKYHKELPKAVLYHKQLFPNNYLLMSDLNDLTTKDCIQNKFKALLDKKFCIERDILNFVKIEKAYQIIASIFDGFRFGHHSAFLFREFELPPNFKADFLLVGAGSGGYEFIFIEFENPYGQITSKNGEFGATIRKGLKQVRDWDNWIEKNYHSLRLVFEKYISPGKQLPKEFLELEKSRIHYVVVAGRRSDFKEKTYQLRRKLLKSEDILLLHYDNLLNIEMFMHEELLN